MRRYRVTTAAALACGLLLAGCGGDDEAATSANQSTSSEQPDYESDASFAEAMIPHHSQAIDMSKLTHDASCAPVRSLGKAIEKAQGPEIKQMAQWLASWGHTEWNEDGTKKKEMGEHGAEHGDGHAMEHDADVPGMVNHRQMTALEKAKGKNLCKQFLALMIAHHKGAIEMAKTEQENGKFQPLKDMASRIEKTQTAEIAKMKALLKAI